MQTLRGKMVQDIITEVKNLLILEPKGQSGIERTCIVGDVEVPGMDGESV